jgi:hypothetical protein
VRSTSIICSLLIAFFCVPAIGQTPSPSGKPSIKIVWPGSTKIRKGDSVTFSVEWANLPEGTAIDLQVVPDLAGKEEYAERIGPAFLMQSPESITGSAGKLAFSWTEQRYACAPLDAPMWCSPLEIGHYRIKAIIHERPFGRCIGRCSPRDPPTAAIASVLSERVEVFGRPDTSSIGGLLEAAALKHVTQQLKVVWPGTASANRYFTPSSPVEHRMTWLAAVHGDRWCQTFSAVPPLQGEVKACLPGKVMGPFGVKIWQMREADVNVSGSVVK